MMSRCYFCACVFFVDYFLFSFSCWGFLLLDRSILVFFFVFAGKMRIESGCVLKWILIFIKKKNLILFDRVFKKPSAYTTSTSVKKIKGLLKMALAAESNRGLALELTRDGTLECQVRAA